MQVVLAVVLVLHGLITTFIGLGAVTKPNAPAMALPSWFDWWPGPFGRSWAFDAFHLGSGASLVGGLVWLAAGAMLLAGGLGWLGAPVLADAWRTLAFLGASVGIVGLVLYFHPIYLVAIAIDVAIIVLLWGRLATAS